MTDTNTISKILELQYKEYMKSLGYEQKDKEVEE